MSEAGGAMLQFYAADLHLHTALSPCAEREMRPDAIIARAQELELEIIAVTDHNSAENVQAVCDAACGSGITVWSGMEVQTREEVHLVCLFDTCAQALALQETVYAHLPALKNDERVFGPQWRLDAEGEVIGTVERLLLVAANLSLADVVGRVRALGGVCIPAHVDRPAYSIIANLGFIPPELELTAVEISHFSTPKGVRERFPQLRGYTLVGNSDAHRLAEMCWRNTFRMAAPSIAELALALAGRDERGTWVDGYQL